jgi:FtsH-binding integral membrane protein
MDFTSAAIWVVILLVIIWLVVLATSIYGLVKRNDISFPVKIFWALVISLAPVVGLIIYVLVGRKARRGMEV